jgi:MFS family permease
VERDAWISWYLFLGPSLFLLGTPLFLWLIDKKGLRVTCVVGSLMNLLGVLLKLPCLWIENKDVGWALVLVGQSLTSIAGVAAMAVPAKLSSVWFAPHERRYGFSFFLKSFF